LEKYFLLKAKEDILVLNNYETIYYMKRKIMVFISLAILIAVINLQYKIYNEFIR